MRYYWEALFSAEYFPYWEFTMLMMLILNLSAIYHMHQLRAEIEILKEKLDAKTIKRKKR